MLIKTALAKLLTVKVAAIAVTAVATGGVAVAAATGNLPTQNGDSPTVPPRGTVSATTGRVTPTSSVASSGAPDAADKNTNGKNAADKNNGDRNAGTSGSPSPSLVGLCQAYTAGAGAEQGKALENPAFTVLITTAGGKDKVSVYCTDLLGTQPGQSSAAHPTGKPTTHPTGPSEAHRTGKPSDTPPSTRPSR